MVIAHTQEFNKRNKTFYDFNLFLILNDASADNIL